MAEIVVRVHDKVNPDDFYRDCQCMKRGDVVAAVADGTVVWGNIDRTLPDWRILILPNVSLEAASRFLAPEVKSVAQQSPRTLQKRRTALDLDSPGIDAGLRAYLDDDTRAEPFFISKMTGDDLLALQMLRPTIADPAIIGDEHDAVIG